MKLIIGLVGEKGSGKETFGKFLKEATNKKVAHIRFSDLLAETLDAWFLPKTRENLQKLAVVIKDGFGPDTLSHATYERIKNLKEEIIIIDGVRWESDVELIRKFPNSLMVYITADLMLRYERLKKRNQKLGEGNASFEQFMKEEKAENELLIPQIGKNSDYKIINNGSLQQFKKEIEIFAQKFLPQ